MKSISKTTIFIILTIILSSQLSCKKNTRTSDNVLPILSIVEPTNLDTIILSKDPEMHVEFTVSDNTALHELEIKMFDSSNQILQQFTPNVMDLPSYAFHTHYIPTGITGLTWVKVYIKATDHALNVTESELKVYIQP